MRHEKKLPHCDRDRLPVETAPVFVGNATDILAKGKRVSRLPLAFRTEGLAQPADVSLAPFYRVHRQRYAVYSVANIS